MGWIILLLVLGALLYFAELVLLPGFTVAAVASFCCFVGAAWIGFEISTMMGFIIVGIALVLVIIETLLFFKTARWKKIMLKEEIIESVEVNRANIGDQGKAITRLAPMGKVLINGEVIQAKTMGEYIDEDSEVEVIASENMNVIVKIR